MIADFSDPEVLWVNAIQGREVIYLIQIRVRANQRDGVLRELRRRIILAFEKEGIPLGISSNMLVMQQKPDPTAPPAPLPRLEARLSRSPSG